jgi:hypothetical protein
MSFIVVSLAGVDDLKVLESLRFFERLKCFV